MSLPISEPSYSFSGSIPQMYDDILGPVYFEPYAVETAKRVAERCAGFKILHSISVLETACGTGRVTNHLRKTLPNDASLTATDISVDMMAVAKKRLASVAHIAWQEADALNLPFDDLSFDVVVCQFGAMFFPDKRKGFTEAFRVLRKGGTFIFSVWDKLELNPIAGAGRKILKDFFEGSPPKNLGLAFSMNDKNEIAELLRDSGFTSIHFDTITKDCIAESAEALAKSAVDGSLISQFVREKDPDAIPILRNKVFESIKEKFGDHPVRGTMQAIIVTAEKS